MIESSSSFGGHPLGNQVWCHPLPITHSTSGRSWTYASQIGEGVVGIGTTLEIAPEQVEPAARRVDVGVLESGGDQSSLEVDDPGLGADLIADQ